MPLISGSVNISVGPIDPNTGLGNVNIVGVPPAGPNLAKEFASALFTDPQTTVAGAAKAQAYFNQMASIIVAHITANALVTSTVVVASVSAVTPGVGVSGPGAGTATGTIS